jgi:hypothetical protein
MGRLPGKPCNEVASVETQSQKQPKINASTT